MAKVRHAQGRKSTGTATATKNKLPSAQKSAAPKRQKFADIVRRQIHELKTNVNAVAQLIHVPRSTLHGWLEANTFSEDVFRQLCDVLKLSVKGKTQAKETYDFEWVTKSKVRRRQSLTTLIGHFAGVDKTRNRCSHHLALATAEALDAFDQMGPHDALVIVSGTVIPLIYRLYDETLAAERAVAAISRGATICVIAPTAARVEAFRQKDIGELQEHEDFHAEAERFRKFAFDRLVKQGVTKGDAGYAVSVQFGQLYDDSNEFFTPGWITSLFCSYRKDRQTECRITLRAPGGELGGLLLYPHNPLYERRVQVESIRVLGGYRSKLVSDGKTKDEMFTFVARLQAMLTNNHQAMDQLRREAGFLDYAL